MPSTNIVGKSARFTLQPLAGLQFALVCNLQFAKSQGEAKAQSRY
jgi:hypothetical protein